MHARWLAVVGFWQRLSPRVHRRRSNNPKHAVNVRDYISTTPTVLVVTDGPPKFAPVAGIRRERAR
jgi:hypothetical protein